MATVHKQRLAEHNGRIFEMQKDGKGKVSFPVVIISQGLGNLGDKNYYSSQAIKQAAADKVYEGKKAYFDHPTATQEEEQPGRSVRDVAGYYKNTKAVQDEDGLWVLRGDFIPIDTNEEVMGLLTHASAFKKEFPDQEFIGISINGDGEGKTLEYADFIKEVQPSELEMEKISQIEGQPINVITKLTSAVSADLVTEPGARGRVLLESKKIKTKRRRHVMFESVRKFLLGAEKNNKELMEEAVKGMLQDEGKDKSEDEKAKEAAAEEAEGKHAEGLAKALLNAKKETKKYEGEAESEYEARCMKQAMKAMKQDEKKEDEKHEKHESKHEDEDEKKESKKEDFPPKKDAKAKKDDGDGDDDSKEKKESKHEDEDEKKEAADDDEGHADAADDKKLIKKMMKQMDEMKKEIESMKQSKKESEDEAKKHHEESAKARIELETRKRVDGVDKVLRESGLPRYATEPLRELFLTKIHAADERKKIIEAAKEVRSKEVEAYLFSGASTGFTEISTDDKAASTDHLF